MTAKEKTIKKKLGILEPARHLGNFYRYCKVVGYSRDSFYRLKKLYEQGGELALQETSRRKRAMKNRVGQYIGQAVLGMATGQPALVRIIIKVLTDTIHFTLYEKHLRQPPCLFYFPIFAATKPS